MKIKSILILILFITFSMQTVNAAGFKKDARQREADYTHQVLKQDEKTKYEKRVFERVPSGMMTMEEYNKLSEPKDKTLESVEIPKFDKPSDMKYVPQPLYKIVRYNDPPGSPELKLGKKLYKQRQINAQGIVSPDFSILVYPAIYYYPDSASTACDLFVIPLDKDKSNLDKILTAKTSHKNPDAILTTDADNQNFGTYRTLTPVDFSVDGTKLLAKEKIGNTADGIWQTRLWVYDFTNKTSYELVEIRHAIAYYWKENKNLELDDKRWDIYPLGFDLTDPARVVVDSYAYTGETPVSLGVWSIDYTGVQSRLVSMRKTSVNIGANGFKIIQDGVVSPVVIASEEKQQKIIEKNKAKKAKKADKEVVKQMKKEYQQTIKDMDAEYKFDRAEYNRVQRYKGSTTLNDGYEKYKEVRSKQLEKEITSDEMKLEKQIQKIQELEDKIKQIDEQIQSLDSVSGN